MPVSNASRKQENIGFLNAISSDDKTTVKKAAELSSRITRSMAREKGAFRKVLPIETVTAADLMLMPGSEEVCYEMFFEPEAPSARQVPLGHIEPVEYVNGKRYYVPFARIMTKRIRKDVSELMVYVEKGYDLLNMLGDQTTYHVHTAEDIAGFKGAIDPALGTKDTVNVRSGSIQWASYPEPLGRESLLRAIKVIQRTKAKFTAKRILINALDGTEFAAILDRNVSGGDLSQDLFQSGIAALPSVNGGVEIMTTIKDEICPEGTVYVFAAPQELGVYKSIEDLKMSIQRVDEVFVEMFAYCYQGAAIGNTAGVCRIDFQVSDPLSPLYVASSN